VIKSHLLYQLSYAPSLIITCRKVTLVAQRHPTCV
jgi:hypothetical protein